MGNVFPPFRFNSSARHLTEMVLFTHGSREMAEQKGLLFFMLLVIFVVSGMRLNATAALPGPARASVQEREGARGAAEPRGRSPAKPRARW